MMPRALNAPRQAPRRVCSASQYWWLGILSSSASFRS
jgi:hypothetical protein